jgi:enhancer of mRNA-decapping protein 3
MASEFIGYNVLVSLQTPPGGKLQGQVADVIGQNLLLHNGMMAEKMWLLDPAD